MNQLKQEVADELQEKEGLAAFGAFEDFLYMEAAPTRGSYGIFSERSEDVSMEMNDIN